MAVVAEIIKQFDVHVEGIPFTVKGKIAKYKDSYMWSISHHYKPTTGAGVYYPSSVTANTLADAEMLFRAYAEDFVPDFEVKANKAF